MNNQFIWLKKIAENDYQTEIKPNVAIHHDTNGRLICALRFYEKLYFFNDSSIMDVSSNYYGAHLFQLDTSAAHVWNKRVYASDIGDYGVHVDKSNNILITGMMNDDFFLTKYSNIGDSLWTRTGGGSQMDWGEIVNSDDEDNLYCAGRLVALNGVAFDSESPSFPVGGTRFGGFLVKYNSVGAIQWLRCMYSSTVGQYGFISSMKVNNEGTSFIGGLYNSNYLAFNSGESQVGPNNVDGRKAGFILSYDTNGNRIFGMLSHEIEFGQDEVKNICLADEGFYVSSVFDNNLNVYGDIVNGGNFGSVLLEKYTLDGMQNWHYLVGGTGQDISHDLLAINQSIFLVGASNNASISFNGIPYSIDFTPNLFIAKLSDLTVGIENVHQSEIFLYPNPNSGSFQLKTEQNLSGKELRIVNKLGQEVYRSLIENDGTTFIQTDLNPGVYFLHCEGLVTTLVIQ